MERSGGRKARRLSAAVHGEPRPCGLQALWREEHEPHRSLAVSRDRPVSADVLGACASGSAQIPPRNRSHALGTVACCLGTVFRGLPVQCDAYLRMRPRNRLECVARKDKGRSSARSPASTLARSCWLTLPISPSGVGETRRCGTDPWISGYGTVPCSLNKSL